MKYDAITFDTQAIETNGFHFDSGWLGQMKQFRNGPVDVIVSQIVIHEIVKHVTEKTRSAKDSLDNSKRKAFEFGIVSQEIPAYTFENFDPRDISRRRFGKFLKEIGASMIATDDITVKQLAAAYFNHAPPFGNPKKKNEFPDAIALLSLEEWAKKGNKRILAISGDTDWEQFAAQSEYIDVVKTVEDAIDLVKKHTQEAEDIVDGILSMVSAEPSNGIGERFSDELSDAVAGLWIYGEGDSAFFHESSEIDLSLNDYSLRGYPGNFLFKVIQAGPHKIVFQVPLDLNVQAKGSFSLYVHDSIDDDNVYIGNANVNRDREIEIAALLTITGNFNSGIFDIAKLEIVKHPETIDVGYLEIDYDDYEDFDPPDFDDTQDDED